MSTLAANPVLRWVALIPLAVLDVALFLLWK